MDSERKLQNTTDWVLCMLGNSACCFQVFCQLLLFFKVNFKLISFLQEKAFEITIRVSNGSDSDQNRRFVGPDFCEGYHKIILVGLCKW